LHSSITTKRLLTGEIFYRFSLAYNTWLGKVWLCKVIKMSRIETSETQRRDNPAMMDWLKPKANKYTSHQNQNDLLKIMAMHVLREVAVCLQQSPFITL